MFISNILLGSNGSFIGSAASGSTSGAGQIGAVVLGSILVASAGASSGVGQSAVLDISSSAAPFIGVALNGESGGIGQTASGVFGTVFSAPNGASAGAGQPGGLVAGSVLSASNGSGAGHGQSPGATFGAVFIGIGGSAAGVGQQAELIIGHIANASNGESLGVGQAATGIFGTSIPFIGVGSNGSAAGFGQFPTADLGIDLTGDIGQSLGVGQTGQLVTGFIGSGAAGITSGVGYASVLNTSTLPASTPYANPVRLNKIITLTEGTMSIPTIVIGDDVQLYRALEKDNATFEIAITDSVKAALVSLDHETQYMDAVDQSASADGADWANSLVAVEFTGVQTGAIDPALLPKNGSAKVEIQVTQDGKKESWFSAVKIVKGHIA